MCALRGVVVIVAAAAVGSVTEVLVSEEERITIQFPSQMPSFMFSILSKLSCCIENKITSFTHFWRYKPILVFFPRPQCFGNEVPEVHAQISLEAICHLGVRCFYCSSQPREQDVFPRFETQVQRAPVLHLECVRGLVDEQPNCFRVDAVDHR